MFFFVAEKMVKIGLQLKALLENVTGIEAEGEDFRWEFYRSIGLPSKATYSWQIWLVVSGTFLSHHCTMRLM